MIDERYVKLAQAIKEGKIKLEDVENAISNTAGSSMLLGDEDETLANKLIEEATANSLGVRHPWLTGIPTLGIWPAISKEKALESISRKLFRARPELFAEWKALQDKKRVEDAELARLQVESDKANQGRNTVSAAGFAAAPLLAQYLASRGQQDRTDKLGSEEYTRTEVIKAAAQKLKGVKKIKGAIPAPAAPLKSIKKIKTNKIKSASRSEIIRSSVKTLKEQNIKK
jgi:hypothetical protein